MEQADRSVGQLGSQWPPLKAGLFGGSVERYNAVAERMRAHLRQLQPLYLWP